MREQARHGGAGRNPSEHWEANAGGVPLGRGQLGHLSGSRSTRASEQHLVSKHTQENHRGSSCYVVTDIRQNCGNTHSLRQLQFISREVKDLSLSLMQIEVGQEHVA